jgi:hypothetical protein
VLQAHPNTFEREIEIPVISGVSEYPIPTDAHLKTRVVRLEYSRTGDKRDYRSVDQTTLSERSNGSTGNPCQYIRRGNSILIQPTPSSGSLRLTYQYRFPRLELRRGVVGTVAVNEVERKIEALYLDTSVFLDAERFLAEGFLSVVDRYGNVLMKGIPVWELNSGSGEVTMDPAFRFQAGESIEPGAFAVPGDYASTHSPLPEECGERYLIEFMSWKALKGDSSNDSTEQNTELKEMEAEIISAFAEADADVDRIPVIHPGNVW